MSKHSRKKRQKMLEQLRQSSASINTPNTTSDILDKPKSEQTDSENPKIETNKRDYLKILLALFVVIVLLLIAFYIQKYTNYSKEFTEFLKIRLNF
ncbi:MAG: hypothetical protein CEN91_326 [Candidatus Berkelbacteria bacterium Licking1014_85]|uniref:Uncharacterized protein n=1 Tax=Candidatus Berkelbacteria bacterium Licking1014_85 TaxID=2017148 RepID=A0A554LJ84_9BACT|nr:MAG: hypothetical protein CEN91_326 [Candidatus Berkelbacteria bacterium Licking1014_85]